MSGTGRRPMSWEALIGNVMQILDQLSFEWPGRGVVAADTPDTRSNRSDETRDHHTPVR